MTNRLFYGDNLEVMRRHIADASVDLVYLDPPFNSNATYSHIFHSPDGKVAQSQIEAFEDTWEWGESAVDAYNDVLRSGNTDLAEMLRAMRGFLKENAMMAYLAMMAVRLIELHRVLKPTGSLYLHCDPTASHYLKLILDGVFGADNFRNEIIWRRTSSSNNPRRWGPVHDVVFFYSRSAAFAWNAIKMPLSQAYLDVKYRHTDERGTYRLSDLTAAGTRTGDSGKPWRGFDPANTGRHWGVPTAIVAALAGDATLSSQAKLDLLDQHNYIYWTPGRAGKPGFPQLKRYMTDGQPIQDVVDDIPPLNSQAQERLGYPTQKPQALLERIVAASSNPGDVVLDPFCGCGTAVHAAEKLGRQWIGIDITVLSINLIEKRLRDAFPGIQFETVGLPADTESAQQLADSRPHDFQFWITDRIGGQAYQGGKKGMDRGIDGFVYFTGHDRGTERAIVSVKAGRNVGPAMVRDLKGVMEREKAPMGIFVCAATPTPEMKREAAAADSYDAADGRSYPRVQIFTLKDLFDGLQPRVPLLDRQASFKRAQREKTEEQGGLDL